MFEYRRFWIGRSADLKGSTVCMSYGKLWIKFCVNMCSKIWFICNSTNSVNSNEKGCFLEIYCNIIFPLSYILWSNEKPLKLFTVQMNCRGILPESNWISLEFLWISLEFLWISLEFTIFSGNKYCEVLVKFI